MFQNLYEIRSWKHTKTQTQAFNLRYTSPFFSAHSVIFNIAEQP